MPVGEILFTLIAPVIARMMFIRWIGNSDLAEEMTGSLRELIRIVTEDSRARLKAERLFTDIAEEVAESLLDIVNIEGIEIPQERWPTIILAVSDTIPNVTMLTALNKLLLKYDLQSDELGKYLLENYPHRQELDPGEQYLYERVVKEACSRLIEIVADLPIANTSILAETLKRSTELANTANITLQRVNHLYNESLCAKNNELVEVKRFEHSYRKAVATRLDNVELLGLNLKNYTSRRQPLTVAYVVLQLKQRASQSSVTVSAPVALGNGMRILITGEAGSGKTTLMKWIAVRAANMDFEKYALELKDWNNSIPFFIRLRDFSSTDVTLPSPDQWVNLNAPNIAQTMPENWVYRQLEAGKALILIDGLDEIPVERQGAVREWLHSLIVAYDRSRFILATRPEALRDELGVVWRQRFRFIDVQSHMISEAAEAARNQFVSGTSSDEISESTSSIKSRIERQRPNIRKTLIGQKKLLEQNAIEHWSFQLNLPENIIDEVLDKWQLASTKDELSWLVATKVELERGVEQLYEKWQLFAELAWARELEVQRMTDASMEQFVNNWHDAVAYAEGNIPTMKQELSDIGRRLVDRLREYVDLKELASNPLLCSMICALNRDQGEDLPTNKVNLYTLLIEALIDRRDRIRGIKTMSNLTLKEKFFLLSDLSYWMMRNKYSASAPRLKVENRLQRTITNASLSDAGSSKLILDNLIQRTGIVREPVIGQIDFAHRTIQEFLIAKAIASEGDIGVLVTHLKDSEWHEVIVLAAGMVSQNDFEELISAMWNETIVRKGWFNRTLHSPQRQLHLLAVSCLATKPILNNHALEVMKKHVAQVCPPKSSHEARVLSLAGRQVIDFLSLNEEDENLFYSIECLLQTGDKTALGSLIVKVEEMTKTTLPIESRRSLHSDRLREIRIIDSLMLSWSGWGYSDRFALNIIVPILNVTGYLNVESSYALIRILKLIDVNKVEILQIFDCSNIKDWSEVARTTTWMYQVREILLGRTTQRSKEIWSFLKYYPKLKSIIIGDNSRILDQLERKKSPDHVIYREKSLS